MYVTDLTHYLNSKGAIAPERSRSPPRNHPPKRWNPSPAIRTRGPGRRAARARPRPRGRAGTPRAHAAGRCAGATRLQPRRGCWPMPGASTATTMAPWFRWQRPCAPTSAHAGETAVYAALLRCILDRTYARASRPVLSRAGRWRHLSRRGLVDGAVDAQALETGLGRLGPGIVDADGARSTSRCCRPSASGMRCCPLRASTRADRLAHPKRLERSPQTAVRAS